MSTPSRVAAWDAAAQERLTMWATQNYKTERARFPFGVYANPPALRADILAALAAIRRLERELDALRTSYDAVVEAHADV